MARGSSAARFQRFARGLNTADGPYGLREGYADDPTGLGAECRDCLNVVSRSRGNVARRDGSVRLKTRSGIKDLSIVGQDSASFAIYSTTGGALYSLTDDLTETELVAAGLSATAPWKFLKLPESGGSGPFYGMNGSDTPREIDSAGTAIGNWTATTGTVPNGKYMVYLNNRLWVAGVSSASYTLYYSDIGDPRDWPVANVVQFNPDSDYPITGLGTAGPYLLVFTERQIHVVYDLDTGANRKLSDNTGTLSPRSIVSTDEGCFFLDPQRGVMVTDGNEIRRIGEQIQPTFDRISDADKVNVTGTFLNRHYYLSGEFDGATSLTLDYDGELGSWWVHSTEAVALGTWDQGSGAVLVAAVKNATLTGGVWELYRTGVLEDDGEIYVSFWSGPHHVFGTPHLRKRCRQIHIDGRGEIDVYIATDFEATGGDYEDTIDLSDTAIGFFGGSGTFGGSGSFGGTLTVEEAELYSLGVARAWSVTFYSPRAEYWEVDAYTMSMDTRRD